MEATSIRISKLTHKRLTDLARKNQSYDNLINEILLKKIILMSMKMMKNLLMLWEFNKYETKNKWWSRKFYLKI